MTLTEMKFDPDPKSELSLDCIDWQLTIDETQPLVHHVIKIILEWWWEWLKIHRGEELKFLKISHKNEAYRPSIFKTRETFKQVSTRFEFEKWIILELKSLKLTRSWWYRNQYQWLNLYLKNKIFIFQVSLTWETLATWMLCSNVSFIFLKPLICHFIPRLMSKNYLLKVNQSLKSILVCFDMWFKLKKNFEVWMQFKLQ